MVELAKWQMSATQKETALAASFMIRYFDIAWLSHTDGPGHRVVLFLQGCHLRCPWCHSPHSQLYEAPLLFFPGRCTACGRCQLICPQSVHRVRFNEHELNRELCKRCGKCVDACPLSSRYQNSGVLALPTRAVKVDALWRILYPQIDILRHVGGLTISGGEPLLQSQALRELLQQCQQEGIHTAVETSGAVPRQNLEEISGLVDCWLFGYRPTPVYVPPGALFIENNLAFLVDTDSRIIIRVPIIAGVTDIPESIERIAQTMQMLRLTEIELLPFHRGTLHFYRAMGVACEFGDQAVPSSSRLDAVRMYLEQQKLAVRIVS